MTTSQQQNMTFENQKDFIVLNWLQTKGKIDVYTIKDIASDFSNGYMLGKALFNAGIVQSMSKFENKTTKGEILNN